MPINYELAKKEGPKVKAALTRAQRIDNPASWPSFAGTHGVHGRTTGHCGSER